MAHTATTRRSVSQARPVSAGGALAGPGGAPGDPVPRYTDHRYMVPAVREPTFLILAAVAPEPLHGYGIIRAVEELSDGRVRLRPGTLYAALDRLVGEGVLTIDREEVVDGRLRRYYRITDAGLGILRRGVERYEANAAAARQQLARRLQPPAADAPHPAAPATAAARRPR